MAVLLSASVSGQDTKEKSKNKGENQEVIIITKGDKDAKVTVEVKDGEVLVNGKPVDEYKGDDITVRRSRGLNGARVFSTSPFRGQSWTYESDDLFNDRPYLGVTTEKHEKGARITDVSDNSAASKAGLKEGDIITRVDDTKVEDHESLSTAIRKHKPEEKATITYLRDGKEQKESVTLGKTSYGFAMAAPRLQGLADMNRSFNFDEFNRMYSTGRGRLGIRAQDTEDGKGVKVLDVDDESPAGKAGIKEDDIITEFDGKNIDSADKLAEAARAAKDKSSMTVKLTRDGRSQTVEIKIPKKLKTANL